MQRLIFFSIVFLIVFAIDLYVFQGFKLLSKKWFPSFSNSLNALYWIIPVGLFVAILLVSRTNPDPQKSKTAMWLSTILISLIITKFVWLIFMVIDDVVRLIRFTGNKLQSEPDVKAIARSEFIVTSGFLLAGSLFGGLVYGIAKGAHNYRIFNRKLALKNLPKEFVGFKIAQISDVHSGSFWSKSSVERGINLLLDQVPDAIFFTGDLVNNKADEFDNFKDIFGKLKANYGVYSVLGNHDYGDYYQWPDSTGVTKVQNLNNLVAHHKSMGWNLLMNESKVIEKDGAKLAILGVENWSSHKRFPKYGSLSRAHSGTENIENKLLLSHDPSHWKGEVLEEYPDIDATFSGHTHGMQFGIDTKYYRWSPVKYQYKEWADLYQENGQYLYVNRGFGYLGYPGRLGFFPEITIFELEQA